MVQRFITSVKTGVRQRVFSVDGEVLGDFRSFFQVIMSSALLECFFGPETIPLNPNIVNDLIEFDNNVPWLARGIPSFIMPRPYRVRARLCNQFKKKWQSFARTNFCESSIYQDSDGDPFWGSAMNRWCHDILPKTALITNLSPSSMLAVWHIFRDSDLLQRARDELQRHLCGERIVDVDPKKLIKLPLLSSIHAETLRLYINTFITVNSSQCDVSLGRWRLPRYELGLLSSLIAHRDNTFWNTKNGLHPVDAFWVDRFLTNLADLTSGPINLELDETRSRNERSRHKETYFSIEGLEDTWFPYGGGYSICPRRYLLKTALMFPCALFVTEFDIECLTDRIELDNWRFGLSGQCPKNLLPFFTKKRDLA
ncbi:Pfs, NACHT and ankyrin domain protein [Xylaria sp. FL1777]|nr:Pfs, NACHT and ankyrin domain protein [Xylaria sp. FL1777]